jgi:hypothetical protein
MGSDYARVPRKDVGRSLIGDGIVSIRLIGGGRCFSMFQVDRWPGLRTRYRDASPVSSFVYTE